MADTVSMALAELVRKAEQNGDVDFLRDGVRVLSQALMEVEVSQHLGAERHERTAERTGQRNGYREREWDTRVGTIGLRVPRVRDGSYFPAMLEPRKRAEQALVAVVREAYVTGVSTRKVDDLLRALGLDGMSKSEVSRICAELDVDWFVNVQFLDGRLLEINPRISTIVYQEDFNMPYLAVKHALGELSEDELRAFQPRVRMTRRAIRYYDQVEYDERAS